jgi:hypothetical protein
MAQGQILLSAHKDVGAPLNKPFRLERFFCGLCSHRTKAPYKSGGSIGFSAVGHLYFDPGVAVATGKILAPRPSGGDNPHAG